MEYMTPGETRSTGKILCCQCGISIDPNPANMCVGCIRTQVDITEGIPKQGILYFCKACERYLQPPNQWISCALESRELLTLCLKRIKGLNQVHLTDASFVWTEPHSKRINVRLTVQKEVIGGAVLQQVFMVQFTVNYQLCPECRRQDAKNFWKAVVQVRQKSEHKKTFFYLEQLILKHRVHSNCLNIKTVHGGIDFYFAKKDDARKLVDFFTTVVPCRHNTSQQLISHDTHSNTYNYKYTFSVEIVPVCKNDIVCLPSSLAHSLGNIGQLCIVNRVTNCISLIDPFSLQTAEVSSQVYWRTPFQAISSPKQLTSYTVLLVEHILDRDRRTFTGQGPLSMKHVLADAWVVPSKDLGLTESEIHTRTHLGHLLKYGDTASGLDLAGINVNNTEFDKMKKENLPDVVLVKKIYGESASRQKKRKWMLKRLQADNETETSSINRDYNDFLEDLEEDPIYRQNVSIYKDKEKMAVDTDDTDDEFPKITLQEMLDDLTIEDDEMTGEDDGATSSMTE